MLGATLVAATPRLVAACLTRVSPPVNSPDHAPTPASTPRTGAAGGATPECAELAATYAQLWGAIRAGVARGDADEEDRLRNRAQVVLGQMYRLPCPKPDPADQGP